MSAIYTPITPIEGGLVHATTLRSLYRTACGRMWRGWKIVPSKLTCRACEEALFEESRYKK